MAKGITLEDHNGTEHQCSANSFQNKKLPDSNWMQLFKNKIESAIITVLAKIFQKPRKYD
jgi:hypothetical protein